MYVYMHVRMYLGMHMCLYGTGTQIKRFGCAHGPLSLIFERRGKRGEIHLVAFSSYNPRTLTALLVHLRLILRWRPRSSQISSYWALACLAKIMRKPLCSLSTKAAARRRLHPPMTRLATLGSCCSSSFIINNGWQQLQRFPRPHQRRS